MTINFSILEQVVNDYLYENQEYALFMKTWIPGWWENKTPAERDQYTKREERSTAKGDTVIQICALLEIQPKSIIAFIKTCNRYTKNHGKWDRYASIGHLNSFQKERLLEMIKTKLSLDWSNHYNCTGRVKKYIE